MQTTVHDSSDTNTAKNTTFKCTIRVYWEDTDAGGVVFYANYLKFFERARTEWLRNCGVAQSTLREQTGGIFVVTESKTRYLHPARLDDLLTVTAQIQKAGSASLTIHQQVFLHTLPIHDAVQSQLLCDGTIRIGWVDATSMRPSRIPLSLLERLLP